MELFKELDISLEKRELISIVGGGGKTTSMFRLGRELLSYGKKVLLATTTAIFLPNENEYENLILWKTDNEVEFLKASTTGITLLGYNIDKEKNKLKGVDGELIDNIFEMAIFDYIIVEADGANRKPIKAPASHEPVIPVRTTKLIGLIGTDCIGKKLYEENAHRAAILAEITNHKLGDIIDEDMIYNLLVAKEGIFKNRPEKSQKYIIMNKAETENRRRVAERVKRMAKYNHSDIEKIIIGSMRCI